MARCIYCVAWRIWRCGSSSLFPCKPDTDNKDVCLCWNVSLTSARFLATYLIPSGRLVPPIINWPNIFRTQVQLSSSVWLECIWLPVLETGSKWLWGCWRLQTSLLNVLPEFSQTRQRNRSDKLRPSLPPRWKNKELWPSDRLWILFDWIVSPREDRQFYCESAFK